MACTLSIFFIVLDHSKPSRIMKNKKDNCIITERKT